MNKSIQLLLGIAVLSALIGLLGCTKVTNKNLQPILPQDGLTFFVISDFGNNGYGYQKQVAIVMGEMADSLSPEFIISNGDQFHVNGVRSTEDPIWISNFENIYTHPSLMVDWFPVLGNHEYHGHTQALIDYSKKSRRWNMPDRYYSIVKPIHDSISIRLIFIDTSPFVVHYKTDPNGYPDVKKQDPEKQLAWLDSLLAQSKEKWKIVIGHHPIYSYDAKHGSTPELIAKLKPLLDKYKVDFYMAGHIHNFQHLREKKQGLDYIITSSASRPRPDSTGSMTLFHSSAAGFDVCSVSQDTFKLYMINQQGQIIYNYFKVKQ